jgi:hypothetical protein
LHDFSCGTPFEKNEIATPKKDLRKRFAEETYRASGKERRKVNRQRGVHYSRAIFYLIRKNIIFIDLPYSLQPIDAKRLLGRTFPAFRTEFAILFMAFDKTRFVDVRRCSFVAEHVF